MSDSKNFHTTCWTEVLDARGNSTTARDALAQLCDRYYRPVLAYLQKAEQIPEHAAEETAHDFFAELLSGDQLKNVDRQKGRFRSYLLGAVKHFLSSRRRQRQTLKRGGAAKMVSLDEAASICEKSLPPDRWFDRQWAVALLGRAVDRVEADCQACGEAELFDKLNPWLTGDAEHGDQLELANQMEIPLNTLKSKIHRLRKRFRDAVKSEIAETVGSDVDIDSEMKQLFDALR